MSARRTSPSVSVPTTRPSSSTTMTNPHWFASMLTSESKRVASRLMVNAVKSLATEPLLAVYLRYFSFFLWTASMSRTSESL